MTAERIVLTVKASQPTPAKPFFCCLSLRPPESTILDTRICIYISFMERPYVEPLANHAEDPIESGKSQVASPWEWGSLSGVNHFLACKQRAAFIEKNLVV
jgi:hypothetical protein